MPGLGRKPIFIQTRYRWLELVRFKTDLADGDRCKIRHLLESGVLAEKCSDVGEKNGNFHIFFSCGPTQFDDFVQVLVRADVYSKFFPHVTSHF